jgi:maintenance of morphology protein 1
MDAFVQGFVTGQFVLAIMLIIVVRLFFLRDTEEIKKEIRKRRLKSLPPKMPFSPLFSLIQHDPERREPCSWVAVLLAQVIHHARNDPIFLNDCLERCNDLLNRKKNSILGEMTVTELNLGKEFPNVQNARIIPIEMGVLVEFEIEYNDQLTMAIETFALMNWPRLDIAALPVCLSVCMSKFCGKVIVFFTYFRFE